MSHMTPDEYARCLQGYTITDCVVRDRQRFTFVAIKDETDADLAAQEALESQLQEVPLLPQRVLPFLRERAPGDQWSRSELRHWDLLRGGAASVPQNQFIGIDFEGRVYVVGSGVCRQEDSLTAWCEGGPLRGGVRKLRTIGNLLYACGGGRSVVTRMGSNQWLSHTHRIPDHPELGCGGFNDIDGFSADDLYAVGGLGEVWHYDGTDWSAIAVPATATIDAVCCGADGMVYIAAEAGLLLKGRGEHWQVLHPRATSRGFRDLVWYEDRLWCSNDYGLWTVHRDRVQRVGLPEGVSDCTGHLDVRDGVMLSAGSGGAAFREDGAWHSIFLRRDFAASVTLDR